MNAFNAALSNPITGGLSSVQQTQAMGQRVPTPAPTTLPPISRTESASAAPISPPINPALISTSKAPSTSKVLDREEIIAGLSRPNGLEEPRGPGSHIIKEIESLSVIPGEREARYVHRERDQFIPSRGFDPHSLDDRAQEWTASANAYDQTLAQRQSGIGHGLTLLPEAVAPYLRAAATFEQQSRAEVMLIRKLHGASESGIENGRFYDGRSMSAPPPSLEL